MHTSNGGSGVTISQCLDHIIGAVRTKVLEVRHFHCYQFQLLQLYYFTVHFINTSVDYINHYFWCCKNKSSRGKALSLLSVSVITNMLFYCKEGPRE